MSSSSMLRLPISIYYSSQYEYLIHSFSQWGESGEDTGGEGAACLLVLFYSRC